MLKFLLYFYGIILDASHFPLSYTRIVPCHYYNLGIFFLATFVHRSPKGVYVAYLGNTLVPR